MPTLRLICRYCGKIFSRSPQKRNKGYYCGRPCAYGARTAERLEREARKAHKQSSRRAEALSRKITSCQVCNTPLNPGFRKTCSPACRARLMSEKLSGKKRQLRVNTCQDCGHVYPARALRRITRCPGCVRRRWQKGVGSKRTRGRARRLGVVYVPGIKPLEVFARDDWRCQLCGRRTPKRLRGTYKPNAPELDHIIPMAAGGGHTWDNVQCACRECNIKKHVRIRGQLRLAM